MTRRSTQALILVSSLYIVGASLGALLSMTTDLPARFGGLLNGRDVPRDFLLLDGTALSPDLAMLLGQFVLIVCAARAGRAGMAGVVGLTLLGAATMAGQLGEPITTRALSPATFNAAQAALVVTNVLLSLGMLIVGAVEWRSRQRTASTAIQRLRAGRGQAQTEGWP